MIFDTLLRVGAKLAWHGSPSYRPRRTYSLAEREAMSGLARLLFDYRMEHLLAGRIVLSAWWDGKWRQPAAKRTRKRDHIKGTLTVSNIFKMVGPNVELDCKALVESSADHAPADWSFKPAIAVPEQDVSPRPADHRTVAAGVLTRRAV